MSFPTYELDLPFEHEIIGYMYAANQAYVVIERNHITLPFIVWAVGLPDLGGPKRPVTFGAAHETKSSAFRDMCNRVTALLR